jgi:hypothetical protein
MSLNKQNFQSLEFGTYTNRNNRIVRIKERKEVPVPGKPEEIEVVFVGDVLKADRVTVDTPREYMSDGSFRGMNGVASGEDLIQLISLG